MYKNTINQVSLLLNKTKNRIVFEKLLLANQQQKNKSLFASLLNTSKYYSTTTTNSTTKKGKSLQEKLLEEKYREKLLEKAKKQGFETIEELKTHLQEEINQKKKEFVKVDPLKDLEEYQEKMSNNFQNDKTISKGPIDASKEQQPFKTLDSYLDVSKIKNLSKQEVEFLWRARFSNKDNTLHAVVPNSVFDPMYKNARQNPAFVLPLPREMDCDATAGEAEAKASGQQQQGMELHYVQWGFVGPTTVHCMVTSLAEYKLHKEYARPHITMSFHTDLVGEKDMVLMNGLVEPNCNISMQDAQLLLLNIQRFYGCMGETTPVAAKRVKLLRDFTTGSPDFNVELLIELAQSMDN